MSSPSSRRDFLRAVSGSALALGASSCGTALPFRGPAVVARNHPDDLIIDAHCHVFNGRDVDITAYGLAIVREKAGKTGHAILKDCLAAFVEGVSEVAPCISQEVVDLAFMVKKFKGRRLDDQERMKLLNHELAQLRHASSGGSECLQNINTRHSRYFTLLCRQVGKGWGGGRSLHALIKRELRHRSGISETEAEILAVQLADEQAAKLLDHFTNYRWVNAYELWRQFKVDWRTGHSNNNADLLVPATLDMNSWLGAKRRVGETYGEATKTYMEYKVELMEHIAILFGGEILSMGGFCPRFAAEVNHGFHRDLGRTFRDPLEILKQAVASQGQLGVKLYPPMGFRGYGNAELDGDADAFEGLNGKVAKKAFNHRLGFAMDVQLERLYRWCAANDIPIMAHTGPTHGSELGYATRAHPEHWEKALGKAGLGLENLRLNLSHLGCWHPEAEGRHGQSEHGQWAKRIVELTGKYPHVYSDLSDMSGLANHEEWRTSFESALDYWSKIPASTPGNSLHKKLLYGSDWFVMAQGDLGRNDTKAMRTGSNDWSELRAGRSYLQRWAQFAKDQEKKRGWRASDLMGHNALRYFGLDKARTRARIDAFFDKHDIYWPKWRHKLERLVKEGWV